MTDRAWETLLARFSDDLVADTALPDWHPPATPMPPELVAQARGLLQKQHDRMSALRGELADVRRQLRALRQVPPMRQDMPILLDRAL